MFITPDELRSVLQRHGLRLGEIVGLGPRTSKLLVLRSFVRARRGRLTYGQLSQKLNGGQVKNTSLSYMGFATRG